MKINFYLQGKKAKEKPIIALFRRNGILVKVNVGIVVSVKHWDTKRQRVKNVLDEPNRDSINYKLSQIQSSFQKLYLEECFESPTKSQVKKILLESIKGKPVAKVVELFEFFEYHIDELSKRTNPNSGKPLSKETINKFRLLKKFMAEFDSMLKFESLDNSFYLEFTDWLRTERDFKPNTIGKYIRALKELLNNATHQGFNTHGDYKKFKNLKIQTKEIYLNEEELKKLFDLDLKESPALDNARNLFLIGCFTGVRHSDIDKVLSEYKSNKKIDEVVIVQKKTGSRSIIPILNDARPLLERKPHNISNQKFNQYIKELGRLAGITEPIKFEETKGKVTSTIEEPKYKLMKTHTARRSFATNSYKRGLAPKAIMVVTGHKKEQSFYEYLRMSDLENAEIVRKAWTN